MKVAVLTALIALGLAGCAGTPIGDAAIGPEKLAEMDDQYCRSIGAVPGADAYIQCRMYKTAERNQKHQAAYQRAALGIAGASQNYGAALQANRPINCTSTANSSWVGAPPSTVTTRCY